MGPSEKYELLDLREYNRVCKNIGKSEYLTLPREIVSGKIYNMWLIDEMPSHVSDGKFFHFLGKVIGTGLSSGIRYRVKITDLFVYYLTEESKKNLDFKRGDVFECEQRHFGAEHF